MLFTIISNMLLLFCVLIANQGVDINAYNIITNNITEAKGMSAGIVPIYVHDNKFLTGESCSTPSGSGTCISTASCSGTSYSGYCPGPADIQCCVNGGNNNNKATHGIDISDALSSSTANCLFSTYSFIVPRGYRSTGVVDSAVCSTLKQAKSTGFGIRDVYMFPCPTCSQSANTQFTELINYLNSNCKDAWSGRVWLDIEGSQYWLGSTTNNKNWYQSLVSSCKSINNNKCGVYSSASQWSSLFGSTSYSYGSELPLWYAHYDNKESFSDFTAFAGWTSPHAKQYAGDITSCSFDIDKNYSPNF